MEENIEIDKYWLMDLINKIEDLTLYVKQMEQRQKEYEYSRYLTLQEVSNLIGFGKQWVESNKDEIGCANIRGSKRFRKIDVEAFMESYYFRIGEKKAYELPSRRKAKRK